MPLTPQDQQFIHAANRFKIYLLLMGGAILVYLLLAPAGSLQMSTAVLGITLCGVFWLTQKLLSLITVLDLELTRLANAVQQSLKEEPALRR